MTGRMTAALAASEQMIGVFFRIGIYLIVSWGAGAAAQGTFATFLAAQAVLATACLFAFDIANTVLAARGSDTRKALFANTCLIAGAAAILLGCLAHLAGRLAWWADLSPSLLPMLAIAALAALLHLAFGGFATADRRFGLRARAMGIQGVLATGVILILMSQESLTGERAIVGWTIGTGLMALTIVAGTLPTSLGPLRPSVALLRSQVQEAMKSYPYFLSSAVIFRVDILIVAAVLGSTQTGIYALALAATEAILNLPRAFVTLILSNAANQKGGGPFFVRAILALLLASVLAAIPIVFFVLPLVLPDSFAEVGVLALVLLPGVVGMGTGTVAAHHLMGSGAAHHASLVAAVSALLALVLTYPLTVVFGAAGAAMATSLVYLVFGVLTLLAMSRRGDATFRHLITPEFRVLPIVLGKK